MSIHSQTPEHVARNQEALALINPELHGRVEQMTGTLDFFDTTNASNLAEARAAHDKTVAALQQLVSVADAQLGQSVTEYESNGDVLQQFRNRLTTSVRGITVRTDFRQAKVGERERTQAELERSRDELATVDAILSAAGTRLTDNSAAVRQQEARLEQDDSQFSAIGKTLNRWSPEALTSAQELADQLESQRVSCQIELGRLKNERKELTDEVVIAVTRRGTLDGKISQLQAVQVEITETITRIDAEIVALADDINHLEEKIRKFTITQERGTGPEPAECPSQVDSVSNAPGRADTDERPTTEPLRRLRLVGSFLDQLGVRDSSELVKAERRSGA